jgi:phosphomannomutase
VSKELIAVAQNWASHDPDLKTKKQVEELIANNNIEKLSELFAGDLEFGTAGLRAEIDAGQSRMNRAVVIRATYGLCQYLVSKNPGKKPKLIVGNDARHMSDQFAQDVCGVATALGLEVFRLPSKLPTPVLAFGVRHLGADAGVMITASHNPPRDNGYKVYDHLGAGIIPPMDKEIAQLIKTAPMADEIKLANGWNEIDITTQYHQRASQLVNNNYGQIKVAFTPMHGVGQETFDACMKEAGFNPSINVTEQTKPDPDFPTVSFPNPEEPGAMDLLLALAKKIDADVAIANDPDADRCALAIPEKGNWKVLSGDELGFLIAWWLIQKSKLTNVSIKGQMVASIVSSSLVPKMAKANGLKGATTLTGVKWMGHLDELIFGYEEAIGYCTDPEFVRDKDGVTTALRIVEMFSYLKRDNTSAEDVLNGVYEEFGVHLTKQLSFRFDSVAKAKEITSKLISNSPTKIGEFSVEKVDDMNKGIDGLPPSSGIRLLTKNGRIIVRPSGTEPKLKCYLEATTLPGNPHENRVIAKKELDSLAESVHQLLTTI